MDMRDGSPSIVRESCPQLQAARRVVMGWLPWLLLCTIGAMQVVSVMTTHYHKYLTENSLRRDERALSDRLSSSSQMRLTAKVMQLCSY